MSICDISESGLATALKSLQGKGHISTVLDVSQSSAVDAWIKTTVARLGTLDGAANIAGLMRLGTSGILSDTDWDTVMNVNGRGVFYALRAEINNMRDGGAIVITNDGIISGEMLTVSR